mmetsp:Transcript_98600/g.317902  ORF Transcript_98600/g.317902 Transcript_98600/m.317902 type:complete len:152 (-) Transcript_98600:834-1289(-)
MSGTVVSEKERLRAFCESPSAVMKPSSFGSMEYLVLQSPGSVSGHSLGVSEAPPNLEQGVSEAALALEKGVSEAGLAPAKDWEEVWQLQFEDAERPSRSWQRLPPGVSSSTKWSVRRLLFSFRPESSECTSVCRNRSLRCIRCLIWEARTS